MHAYGADKIRFCKVKETLCLYTIYLLLNFPLALEKFNKHFLRYYVLCAHYGTRSSLFEIFVMNWNVYFLIIERIFNNIINLYTPIIATVF